MDGEAPPQALHARLMEGVRRMVLDGDLKDGAKAAETALCVRFGVSRTPMREALKGLAAEGWLELLPNRGARVAPLRAETLAAAFELKGAIERLIGAKAATRATPADMTALETIHADLAAALADRDARRYTALNEAFHSRLARAAGNPAAEQVYGALMAQALRARHRINLDPDRMAASYHEHEGIMAALRARAPLDLADRLARHNDATARALLALFADTPRR